MPHDHHTVRLRDDGRSSPRQAYWRIDEVADQQAVRRLVIGGIASGALATGCSPVSAAQTASAQPADGPKSCTEDCKKAAAGEAPTMTADQALAIIHKIRPR